jgi:ClpP class serine protease
MCGGNTTYPEIIQSLAMAHADMGIKRIVLNISSPGGYVDGLFDCLGALEACTKPKETRASMADSAAYAIACLGGKITASNKAAEFGSVGVCATYVRYDGVEIYDIVSSNAPNKRPDPSTKEGQAVIREGLDAIEELFIDAIARGRGTDIKNVAKNFGRGAVFLATAALSAGMIDAISGVSIQADTVDDLDDEPEPEDAGEPDDDDEEEAKASAVAPAPASALPARAPYARSTRPETSTQPAPAAPRPNASAAPGGAATTRKTMTKDELKAQHPELFSAVYNDGKAEGEKGKTEAVTAALADEKDRVEAHFVMGEASGDLKLAMESVRNGAKMTHTLSAKYMSAGLKKRDVDARTEDDAAAAAATSGAAGKNAGAKSFDEQVADSIEAISKGGVAA